MPWRRRPVRRQWEGQGEPVAGNHSPRAPCEVGRQGRPAAHQRGVARSHVRPQGCDHRPRSREGSQPARLDLRDPGPERVQVSNGSTPAPEGSDDGRLHFQRPWRPWVNEERRTSAGNAGHQGSFSPGHPALDFCRGHHVPRRRKGVVSQKPPIPARELPLLRRSVDEPRSIRPESRRGSCETARRLAEAEDARRRIFLSIGFLQEAARHAFRVPYRQKALQRGG